MTIYSLLYSLSNFEPAHFPMSGSVASCPEYRFLRRQVRWSGIPISWGIFQFTVIHIVKGLSTVNEAEADAFLEFFCFFYDPAYVGNLISGSSAFSKTNLNIWKFTVHVLLKPGFNSMWTVNFQMFKLVLEKAKEPEIKLPTSAGSWKSKRVPEKHLFLFYWLCQSLWLCGSQSTVENSERDGNTRPPDLPLEKSVCRSRSNS